MTTIYLVDDEFAGLDDVRNVVKFAWEEVKYGDYIKENGVVFRSLPVGKWEVKSISKLLVAHEKRNNTK